MYTMYVAVNEKGEVKKELKEDNEIGGVREKREGRHDYIMCIRS